MLLVSELEFWCRTGALYCSQLWQLFIYLILLTRKGCPTKPHGTPRGTINAPRLCTHDPRLCAHDPRLCTHDPLLLPKKFSTSTHCKILERQVMNEKMNSNSMLNMYKNNTSVLIKERNRLNVSENLTICSLVVVF